ncbi:MAK10-like protein [Tanacetum coccineum]
MDHYTMKALWIYCIRGDDEVELTDEESSDNDDEIAEVFRIDTNIFDYETPICSAFNEFNYLLKKGGWILNGGIFYPELTNCGKPTPLLGVRWYEALRDLNKSIEALRNKAIMEGSIKDDDESRYEQKRQWNTYTNYDDAYEINHEHNKSEELCEIQEQPVCNIRRYMMIKYSFNDDEEYVAVKEDEYDDLTVTRKEACRAYQEIFQIMDEGWMITILKTNTPYPSKKIRRIRACTHQRPLRNKDQYAVSRGLNTPYSRYGINIIFWKISSVVPTPRNPQYALNIGLLEETDHIFGLADETKSYPIGIVKDVKVRIGKQKLLNDFYVIDMKKDPETPLLVGKGSLATTNAVIDCRKAKIAVGEGITRSVFGVKGVDLGEEEAPYWTTLGKRESYKPRPSSDGIGALPINLKRNMWESEDLIDNPINWDKPPKDGDGAWHAKIRIIDLDGEEFNKTLQSIPTIRRLSERESPREIINLDHFYDT